MRNGISKCSRYRQAQASRPIGPAGTNFWEPASARINVDSGGGAAIRSGIRTEYLETEITSYVWGTYLASRLARWYFHAWLITAMPRRRMRPGTWRVMWRFPVVSSW